MEWYGTPELNRTVAFWVSSKMDEIRNGTECRNGTALNLTLILTLLDAGHVHFYFGKCVTA